MFLSGRKILLYIFQYALWWMVTINISLYQGWLSSNVRNKHSFSFPLFILSSHNHISIEIACTHRKLLILSVLVLSVRERWSTNSRDKLTPFGINSTHTQVLVILSAFYWYFIYKFSWIFFFFFSLVYVFFALLCSQAHLNSNRHNIYYHRSKLFVIAPAIYEKNWIIIDFFYWIQTVTHV